VSISRQQIAELPAKQANISYICSNKLTKPLICPSHVLAKATAKLLQNESRVVFFSRTATNGEKIKLYQQFTASKLSAKERYNSEASIPVSRSTPREINLGNQSGKQINQWRRLVVCQWRTHVEELDALAHQMEGRQMKSRRPAAGRQRASVILDDMCLAGSRGSNREEQVEGGGGQRWRLWWQRASLATPALSR
jgi:hypothetical protein